MDTMAAAAAMVVTVSVMEEEDDDDDDARVISAKVARWQNLIPSFPWIAPGWRAWGRNPRKGRDHILQLSVAEL